MKDSLLRQYARSECGQDGYPLAWHRSTAHGAYPAGHSLANPAIKDLIRMQAEHRCLRCGHPYPPGISSQYPRGEWTPCDRQCKHSGPVHVLDLDDQVPPGFEGGHLSSLTLAHWRILTVHHLDEDKANCRWWNLAALCQRCHLRMQRAVVMGRPYHFEHSEWFRPFAAGFYAMKYLDEDLTREETTQRLPDLLALEQRFTQEVLL